MSITKKYRPKKFDGVKGQRGPTALLKNTIVMGKPDLSYLFCGPFGTGKTSLARVFAMAVNCLNVREDGEPCGECESCKSVIDGKSKYVLELDAASQRDVAAMDVIKELALLTVGENVYRIIILDECHALSATAQSSLLKLLEEPPSSTIFILVTTDPSKLIETIRSRCIIIPFKMLSLSEIVDSLRVIVYKELGIDAVDDKLLFLIAKNSEGSLRDAQKIIDVMLKLPEYDLDSVANLLGVFTQDDMALIADVLVSGDVAYFIESLGILQEKGLSIGDIYKALVVMVRDMIVCQIDKSGEQRYESMIAWSKLIENVNYPISSLMKMSGVLSTRRVANQMDLEMVFIEMMIKSGVIKDSELQRKVS